MYEDLKPVQTRIGYVIMYEDLKPVQTRTERDYLKGLKNIFPLGDLWKFPIRFIGEVWQDNAQSGDTIRDTIPPGVEIQDVILGLTGLSNMMGTFVSCFAAEMMRFDDRTIDLQREAIPGLSVELLPSWERVAALPDPNNLPNLTTEERQIEAQTKIYGEEETTTTQWYIDLALEYGFVIEIDTTTYNTASVCGVARCGASRCGKSTKDISGYMNVKIISGTANLDLMKNKFYDVQAAHFILLWEDLR